MKAKLPENENARLAALERYKILDTLPEQAYDDITRLASQICNTPMALVSLVDKDRQWFKSRLGLEVNETSRDLSFCAHAILQDDVFIVPDAAEDERFRDNALVQGGPKIRFYAGAPLLTPDGHPIGTLCAIDNVPRKMSSEQEEALKALSRQVVAQLELQRQYAEQSRTLQELKETQAQLDKYRIQLERANAVLETLAVTDDLTGLSNRRAFNERLQREVQRSVRYGTPLSLLLLDVDNFKSYNDSFGHPEGDQLLKTIAQLLCVKARDTDMPARYGGEEFALVLPDTDEAAATALAERLREFIEQEAQRKRVVTASIGAATLTPQINTAEALVAAADAALYHAKQNGRNRIMHANHLQNIMPLNAQHD